MSPEQAQFLSLPQKPARLTAEQLAWCVGMKTENIAALIAAGLIDPLGHPRRNSVKRVAWVDVERLCADRKWLSKITDAIDTAGHIKNQRRASRKQPER